jgi:hypothetical protein
MDGGSVVASGAPRPPPPDFGRSENGGGSTGAPHYYSPPQIFRPSAIPELVQKISRLQGSKGVHWSKLVKFKSDFFSFLKHQFLSSFIFVLN